MANEQLRVLILGDFGAREHRGLSDAGSLKSRRVRPVDRDDLDAALGAMKVEIHLSIEPGTDPIVVRVGQLDDFHPDQLVERVAEFQRLRELKASVTDAGRPPMRSASPSPQADAAAIDLSQGSVLDLILDADSSAMRPIVAPRDDLSKFVARAVQDHVVTRPSSDQQTLIDQIDGVITATMRVVLHHRDFQSAESLWRELAFLTRHVETDENVRMYVADVTRRELEAAARSPDADESRSLLAILRGNSPGAHGGWSLVIGAYSFEPADISLLAGVAELARKAGVPWISAADSRFAGIDTFDSNADPDDWDASPVEAWDAFRRTEGAAWIALALPRFLLRVPYGARTDECSALRFEETDDGALPHAHCLWGNSAFLIARLWCEAAVEGDDPPAQGVISGLPLFVENVDGLSEILPVAEAFLGGRALTRLLERGLTAIASERDGDSVRIPRIQSTAAPPTALARARATGDQ